MRTARSAPARSHHWSTEDSKKLYGCERQQGLFAVQQALELLCILADVMQETRNSRGFGKADTLPEPPG
jgi:hypothetical protein